MYDIIHTYQLERTYSRVFRTQDKGVKDMNTQSEKANSKTALNFDIQSYPFRDLDLKMAVQSLEKRDQKIVVLHLMGHKQRDIAQVCSISRSMISKRLHTIMSVLAQRMR